MADRRQQILDSAATLFAERGYQSTPVGAIAEDAGVSQGLVFWHFDSKLGVLSGVIDTIGAKFTEEVLGAADGLTGLDAVIAVIRARSELSRRQPVMSRLLVALHEAAILLGPPVADVFTHLLTTVSDQVTAWVTDACARGEVQVAVAPEALASVIVGALEGALQLWALDSSRFSLEAADESVIAVLEGLRAQ